MLTLLFACQSSIAAVVLQYHHVSQSTPPSTSVSPSLFEAHLNYIASQGYQVWPLPRVVSYLKANKEIPDKTVVITFDDAYSSIYEHAYPLLKKRNWPFTVFVATQAIEQKLKPFMSWSQLTEMATTTNATLANHTHTHLHLVRRKTNESHQAWLTRIDQDIEIAETLLQERTGQSNKLLAYPYGEYTQDVQDLVSARGYTAFGQQSGALGLGQDLSALPRFPMTNRFGAMTQFKTKIASLPLIAEHISPKAKIITEREFDKGLSILFKTLRPRTQCYFQGAALKTHESEGRLHIEQLPNIPIGRSRINCTAPSTEQGRYYWFSLDWMRPMPDGSWYVEH